MHYIFYKNKAYELHGKLDNEELNKIKNELFNNKVESPENYILALPINKYEEEKSAIEDIIYIITNKHVKVNIYDVYNVLSYNEIDKKIYKNIKYISNNININRELVNKESNKKEIELIIKKYYNKKKVKKRRKELNLKEPNKEEIKIIEQIWSKCVEHKIFNANIDYEENNEKYKIMSLFKTFIKGSNDKTNKPFIINSFKSNSARIKITPKYDIFIRIELSKNIYNSLLKNIKLANSNGGIIKNISNIIIGNKNKINKDHIYFPTYINEKNIDVLFVGNISLMKNKSKKIENGNLLYALTSETKTNYILEELIYKFITKNEEYINYIQANYDSNGLNKIILKSKGIEIEINEYKNILYYLVVDKRYAHILENNIKKYKKIELKKIGEFKENNEIIFTKNKKIIGHLYLDIIKNIPSINLKAKWKNKKPLNITKNIIDKFKEILKNNENEYFIYENSNLIRRSYENIYSQSILLKPIIDEDIGINISTSLINLKNIDGYYGSIYLFDEVIRKNISNGGNPRYMAVLNNFGWTNTKNELGLGNLIRSCKGLYKISTEYNIPIISGEANTNNKTNNEYLLITAISKINSIYETNKNIINENELLYILGDTKEYYIEKNIFNNINYYKNLKLYEKVYKHLKLFNSISAIEKKGLLYQIIKNTEFIQKGFEIETKNIHYDPYCSLYSNYPGRFLVSIDNTKKEDVEKIFKNEIKLIGRIRGDKRIIIKNKNKKIININRNDIDLIKMGYYGNINLNSV